MEFEWGEAKRRQNLAKHGVDLLFAALIFEGPVLTRVDDRRDYGELRFASLGLVEGVPFTVIHTERGGRVRLISAWKGGRKDHDIYRKSFP